MHIERPHTVGKPEAIRRLDTFIDHVIARDLPNGITVTDISKIWTENVLNFSFKARKFFFSATLSGTVQVHENSIIMDFDLSPLIAKLVPETEIQGRIDKELDELFPKIS